MKLSRLKQIIKETISKLDEIEKLDPKKGFLCCCSNGNFNCEGYKTCQQCCKPYPVKSCEEGSFTAPQGSGGRPGTRPMR